MGLAVITSYWRSTPGVAGFDMEPTILEVEDLERSANTDSAVARAIVLLVQSVVDDIEGLFQGLHDRLADGDETHA